jgi:hypothetical protein
MCCGTASPVVPPIDTVENATMKLMASDQAQPQLRDSAEMDQLCGTESPLYRCFRPTRRMADFWLLAMSNLGREQITLPT